MDIQWIYGVAWEEVLFSDWATLLVVVPKPIGDVCVCGDYKVTLNAQLNIETYPLPTPQELFATLNGGVIFTKLDLSKAYQQLELRKDCRKLVSINTHRGLYRFKRLPYGVAPAPAQFQKVMETILRGIEAVCIFLDDILVAGKDQHDHDQRLTRFLERLKNAGVVLELSKCKISQIQGHPSILQSLKNSG